MSLTELAESQRTKNLKLFFAADTRGHTQTLTDYFDDDLSSKSESKHKKQKTSLAEFTETQS